MDLQLPDIYQEIEAVTDRETAVKIGELFQGCQVYFPVLNKSGKQRERDAAIYREKIAGAEYTALAHKYGLTERRVRAIVEAQRPKQGLLPI